MITETLDLEKLSDKELEAISSNNLESLSDSTLELLSKQEIVTEKSKATTPEPAKEKPQVVENEFMRGAVSGLMKGGANMLETEQKLLDIVTAPSRTSVGINENASFKEKMLGQNIKMNIAPVTNTIYGDMAKQAKTFAEDYLKTKSFGPRVAETVAQAPAFIAEVAMAGGGKILPAANKFALPVLGAIQGSEEGKIGAGSLKQAGLNAALGKVFGAIEQINPGPQTSMALKTIATASRAVFGGVTGGITSALSNGDLYSNDPSKFENFLVDFVASGLMTAMPSSKPYDLAKKLSSVVETKTKLFDELVGTMKESVAADLNHSIAWGKERPVEAMFNEVMSGQKPPKTYKELVGKTESKVQEVQAEKAKVIDGSSAKIEIEPTLGIETLKRNEQLSLGGMANRKAIAYYDAVIKREKALVADMTVFQAFKRQAQLRMELNDDAMIMQNKPPFSKTEKMVNEFLIRDYSRAISDAEPAFKKLSAKESSLISLKDLLVKRSVVEQTSQKAGFNIQEAARAAQLRGAGVKMSVMGTLLQGAKDIILRGSPVERMTKEIMNLQKEIDTISKLQAKKTVVQEKIQDRVKMIGRQYTPVQSSTFQKRLGGQKFLTKQPTIKGIEQLSIEGRILGKAKQLPAPEKFIRTRLASWEQR